MGFWIALGMIFLAELGDKTQLVALSLATCYKARTVLAGVFAATLAVHLVSVGLGGLVGKFLPHNWVQFVAGLAFIGFGLWTLRGDSVDEEADCARAPKSVFWLVATTFFLAELGDKTMISTVTLAAKYSLLQVWLGSTLGMVLSDGLAILVGSVLGKNLPERAIKIGASIVFFAFGLHGMFQGRTGIPAAAWGVSAALTAVAVYLLFLRTNTTATVLEQESKSPAGRL